MFFGKKREKPPSPPWLKWVIIGFVLLAVVGNLRKHSPVHQAVNQATEQLNPHKIINFSEYKHLLFPHGGSALDIKDISEGAGEGAACGQEVTIDYQQVAQNGAINNPVSMTFHIGDGNVMPALENGVEGMKAGGKRSIIAPPQMTSTHAAEHLEVILQKLSPSLPDAATVPYRIATLAPGTAPVAACGHPVTVNLTLWSVDGKKLYATSAPITFTPGKSEMFLGLAQGVLGLGQGGKRLLVVPPPFQTTLNGNKPILDLPFPANQTVLVEVEIAHNQPSILKDNARWPSPPRQPN